MQYIAALLALAIAIAIIYHSRLRAQADKLPKAPCPFVAVTANAAESLQQAPAAPIVASDAIPDFDRPEQQRTSTAEPPLEAPVILDNLSVPIFLTYTDAAGARSERLVTLKSLDGWTEPDGSTTIETLRGYCHMRRMARTFKMRRVIGLYDPNTGEQIADLMDYAGLKEKRVKLHAASR